MMKGASKEDLWDISVSRSRSAEKEIPLAKAKADLIASGKLRSARLVSPAAMLGPSAERHAPYGAAYFSGAEAPLPTAKAVGLTKDKSGSREPVLSEVEGRECSIHRKCAMNGVPAFGVARIVWMWISILQTHISQARCGILQYLPRWKND
jgi:hypothetical protein